MYYLESARMYLSRRKVSPLQGKWVKVKSLSRVRLFVTPWTSPPGSSVHVIFQAGVLEWGAISFSGGSTLVMVHIVHRCGTTMTVAHRGLSQQEQSLPRGLQLPQALGRLAPSSSFLSFLNNLLSHFSIPMKCSSLPWVHISQLGLPCGHHINVSRGSQQAPRWALFRPETSGPWWKTLPESLLQACASYACGGSSHSVLVIPSKTESVPVLPVD